MNERREFLRLHFNQPIEYMKVPSNTSTERAVSKNISESGILFQTETTPPDLSSILLMDLDYRTVSICKEIEKKALTFNNRLVGKVVRVEENSDNSRVYEVGVCFITQGQKISQEFQETFSNLSK